MEPDLISLHDRPFDLLVAIAERAEATLRRRGESVREAGARVGLAFRSREEWYITPREEVREILFPLPLTRLPRAQPWLLGLANVRGFLVAVTDFGHFLGRGPTEPSDRTRLLWLSHARLPAALLVDEVAGFRLFEATEMETSDGPSFLGGIEVIGGQSYRHLDIPHLAEDPSFLEAAL